ncbi:MAG: hypothetical protein IJ025_07820 [Clostridia bacterium]|nr:hypothetical protein [Clostridia bacterium]
MNNTKHNVFVKHLKLTLQENFKPKAQPITSLDDLFAEDDEDVCNDEITKELEKMFDELFSPSDDNN